MSFVVPTTFTARDKYSATLLKMDRANMSFTQNVELSAIRANRALNSFAPALSATTKELLSYIKSSLGIAAVTKLIYDTGRAIKDYEINVQNFRGIVSDLTDREFKRYKQELNDVAKETRESAGQTFFAAEKIAALNADFAKTSDGMSEMTRQAITLARASDGQLGPAAENLVGIMNQFDMKAREAARAANVLAAGEKVGAASILQSAEAYKNFGAVAYSANITLEQSQGLIQTLGRFMVLGAEAGTGLKSSIIRLQQAGLGYASGQFRINDALQEARDRMLRYKTEKQRDAYITKVFGLHQENIGRILLNNVDIYKEFTKQVTGTNAAQELAAIKTDSVTEASRQLWNTWVNLTTTSDSMNKGMSILKNTLQFLARNLDSIVYWGGLMVGTWILAKTAIWAVNTALAAQAVWLGIVGAKTGIVSVAVGRHTAALLAHKIAVWALANPYAALVVGLGMAAAATYQLMKTQSKQSIVAGVNANIQQSVIDKTIAQRAEVEKNFATLRRSAAGTKQYTDALRQIENIHPGIIRKYDLERASVESLDKAQRDLIRTMEERARKQAVEELYIEAVKERIRLEQRQKDLSNEFLANPLKYALLFGGARTSSNKEDLNRARTREEDLMSRYSDGPVNPEKERTYSLAQIIQTNNARVTLENKTGLAVNTNDSNIVTVKTTPTYGYQTN